MRCTRWRWATVVLVACTFNSEAEESPASVPHVICSAFYSTSARYMALRKQLSEADKLGELAERHARKAIELDVSAGLQAWATRDLVSQLSFRWRANAEDPAAYSPIADKHRAKCDFLSGKLP